MKKWMSGGMLSVLCVGAMAIGAFAAENDTTFTGQVMDSDCAKMGSHKAMMKKEQAKNVRECTNKCANKDTDGVKGQYVLYDSATKTTYQLGNQEKVADFAGQDVKVIGSLDSATKTIHVTSITPKA